MAISVIKIQNPGFEDLPDILYAPIIEGKRLNICAESEDVAILVAMGHKYDGANSQFGKMACRMLGIKSKWAER